VPYLWCRDGGALRITFWRVTQRATVGSETFGRRCCGGYSKKKIEEALMNKLNGVTVPRRFDPRFGLSVGMVSISVIGLFYLFLYR